MSNEEVFDIEGNYKRYYGIIFSFFYLFQGIHQVIPAIVPYYLLFVFGEFNAGLMLIISSYALLPWSLKFLVGIVNDKWGSDRWGRRFPFIIVFGCLAGVTWIAMTFLLPTEELEMYSFLLIYLLIANIGMAVADTCLDGMILDVTPKNKLAKVQGYTWSMLMLGNAVGVIIGYVFYLYDLVPLIFLITGFAVISSVIFTFKVREPPIKKDVKIKTDLKRIFLEGRNYKVMFWTFITAMVYPIAVTTFMYYTLVTMGTINFESAIVSLQAGESIDAYIFLNILISGASGIGIVLGSIMTGRFGDKSRKSAIRFTYFLYLPFLLISSLFMGLVLGLIGHMIYGIIYGSITIVGQTIRGDIAKKNFPDLKSTFYALLISFSNFGQTIGGIILAYLFISVAPVIGNFYIMILIVMTLCTGLLVISFLSFKTIEPGEYEFERLIEVVDNP